MTHLVPVIRPVLGTPFRRDLLYRRAGAMPAFHIAPARTQTAADLITGSVLGTYNSATPAMEVGSDGVLFTPAANAPVIGYDPTTLACLGARVWGVVTNLGTRSQEFDHANWTKSAASVNSNVIVAPDGTLTADALVDTTANTSHSLQQSFSATGSTAYTIFCWMKKGSKDYSCITFAPQASWGNGSSATRVFFNLANGTIATSAQATGRIFAFANGWYLCIATATTVASPGAVNSSISSSANGTSISYAGNADETLYVWGYQPSLGSVAGPYVPTTTTSASATADVWDLTNLTAGANNIRSLYARVRTPASGTSGIISLNDNSSSNRIELQTTGTSAKLVAVTGGSTIADITGGTISANTAFSIAARIVGDDYAVSVNGSPVVTDTAGAKAVVDRIFFGRTQAGEYLNNYIVEAAGWTQALTNQQLQASAA